MELTREEAARKISNYHEGKIFTVTFVKRTSGEVRKMNCRKGVSKGITGEGHKFDPQEKKLVCVWDLQKSGYRMISLDSIISIKMEGEEFTVNGK